MVCADLNDFFSESVAVAPCCWNPRKSDPSSVSISVFICSSGKGPDYLIHISVKKREIVRSLFNFRVSLASLGSFVILCPIHTPLLAQYYAARALLSLSSGTKKLFVFR